MNGARKLHLVKGPPAEDDEATTEERAGAEALRDALGAGTEPLAAALAAAHAPSALAPADLDALVDRALGDEAASTAAERAAAERLRAALDAGSADLVLALRAATKPASLDTARNDALIEAALRAPLRLAPRRGGRRMAPVTMAALASVAAMAAGVALLVGRAPQGPRAGRGYEAAALQHARSTEDLFDPATPFPRRGEESARVDRIASARAADLRNNRFAAWGVR